MTDKTPDTVNELVGAFIGAEEGEQVVPVDENDFAALGIWEIYYRKPTQRWAMPLSRFDNSTVRVTKPDIHMDDFVGDMAHNGNEKWPGWDSAIAHNKKEGVCFSFGSDLAAANKFIHDKIFNKGFGK